MSGMVEMIRLWAVGPFKAVECSDSISLGKIPDTITRFTK